MRVLVTGATGFIGRAIVPILQREGHTVIAWARSESRARGRLGADVEIVNSTGGLAVLRSAIEQSDAIVNLAGEPIVGSRWTAARRQVLRDSRVAFTSSLVAAIAAARQRPRVLVSGSAVGYYGNRGDEVLSEQSSPGHDFLAQLCQDWEAAAVEARDHGLRVMLLRTGVVLGRDGGALAQMLPPFRLGVGGPVAHGRQWMPWIHLHDLVAIIARALTDERYEGSINGVAPAPVTSREFARTLGRALDRPAILPVPALALRAIFGEAAIVLLGSQRVDAAALRRLNFDFAFPTLDAALADVLGGTSVGVHRLSAPPDAHGNETGRRYLETRRPTYELRTRTTIDAPVEEAFAFFSRAENLGLITPAAMQFSVAGPGPTIDEGTAVEYRMRIARVPISWRSRILGWRPGSGFVDIQESGPYRSWWHEHEFRSMGSSTVMEDRVCYAPPFGVLGRIANRLFIAPTLRSIFRYRADAIRLRFGAAPSSRGVRSVRL